MVPEGWELVPLKEVVSKRRKITYGIVVPGPHDPDGNYMIRAQDYSRGWVNLEKIYRVGSQIDESYKRSRVKADDILLTIVGSVGNTAQVPAELDGANLTQQTARLAFDDNCSGFFHAILVSDIGKKQIYRFTKSGVQPSLNLGDVEKFLVPSPPRSEQKKIALILSTWDRAITATKRLLENSQQRKKGLMQKLLTGKKRLPGFEGEWEARQISKTGKIVSGGTPDTNDLDLWSGDVQWLTPTDITALKTHFIYDTPRKITEKGVKESSATLMPSGSLCVCTRASVGLMAISTTPITTNQGFKSVVPNNKHDVEYLYYLFSFNRHVFIRYSSGSTFMELSKKDFAKITFDYPPLTEQKAIARVLASANNEIEQLQKRVGCLKQEKKALMQQLLTGKLRVKVDAEAA